MYCDDDEILQAELRFHEEPFFSKQYDTGMCSRITLPPWEPTCTVPTNHGVPPGSSDDQCQTVHQVVHTIDCETHRRDNPPASPDARCAPFRSYSSPIYAGRAPQPQLLLKLKNSEPSSFRFLPVPHATPD